MNRQHPILDYLRRLFQLMGIAGRQLTKVARRRLSGIPVEGHLLLREGIEQAGGCFIKFGQILSLQMDTLPREYCDALLSLLDRVPTAPREAVDLIIREDLKGAPEQVFRTFDYTPLASASIGQVHRAQLKDGTQVAVKVQRPNVRYLFYRDLLLMRSFVVVIFFLRIRSLYFMRDPVRELATWTRDELDYRREASHCNLLAANAEDSGTERLPGIYWDLTSSRVLTMEFLDGVSVSEYLRAIEAGSTDVIEKLRARGFVPAEFSNNVIGNFLRDAFRFGVFHADLHPANLLILPNNVVGYVDFGIVAKLTSEARRKQIELTLAYSRGNEEEIYRGFLNICMVGPDADLEGMRARISTMARSWYEEPAINGRVRFRISITAGMMDLLTICRDYGVLVDREMIKYIRSVFLADGLVQRLAPGFDIAQALRVVVEDYLVAESRRQVLSPAGGLSLLTDMLIWTRTGPGGMVRAMDLVERRKISLHAGVSSRPDKARSRQLQASASGLVWAFSVLFLALSGGLSFAQNARIFDLIAIIFVASWTVWLAWLVSRVVTGSSASTDN